MSQNLPSKPTQALGQEEFRTWAILLAVIDKIREIDDVNCAFDEAMEGRTALETPIVPAEVVVDQSKTLVELHAKLAQVQSVLEKKHLLLANLSRKLLSVYELLDIFPYLEKHQDAVKIRWQEIREITRNAERLLTQKIVSAQFEQSTMRTLGKNVLEKVPDEIIDEFKSMKIETARILDAEILDAEILDAEILDAEILEGEILEGETIEADIIEGEILEGEVLDGKILDTETQELVRSSLNNVPAKFFDLLVSKFGQYVTHQDVIRNVYDGVEKDETIVGRHFKNVALAVSRHGLQLHCRDNSKRLNIKRSWRLAFKAKT